MSNTMQYELTDEGLRKAIKDCQYEMLYATLIRNIPKESITEEVEKSKQVILDRQEPDSELQEQIYAKNCSGCS